MSKIYAFANQKGGVGKTTSVVNVAAFLAESQMRVLVVDIDPQANATSGFGFDKASITRSTYDLLLEHEKASRLIVHHQASNVFVLPASPALSGAEVELVNLIAREYRLRNGLEEIIDSYDYVLIDCPPSLGLLTVNALTAAKDGVIIPVQCEYLALEGLTQLVDTIRLVRQHLNKRLRIRGLILTMYDNRTNLSREVVSEVRTHFPDQVFQAIIPRNVRLSESPSHGVPISLYDPNSTGAFGYKVLAAEILQGDRARKR